MIWFPFPCSSELWTWVLFPCNLWRVLSGVPVFCSFEEAAEACAGYPPPVTKSALASALNEAESWYSEALFVSSDYYYSPFFWSLLASFSYVTCEISKFCLRLFLSMVRPARFWPGFSLITIYWCNIEISVSCYSFSFWKSDWSKMTLAVLLWAFIGVRYEGYSLWITPLASSMGSSYWWSAPSG